MPSPPTEWHDGSIIAQVLLDITLCGEIGFRASSVPVENGRNEWRSYKKKKEIYLLDRDFSSQKLNRNKIANVGFLRD